jgi:hypothetical protein
MAGRASGAQEEAVQKQYVYKTTNQRKLTLDVDNPPDWNPTYTRPGIVFFGGGKRSGTLNQLKPRADYFALRGLVCVRADDRVRRDGIMTDKCVEDTISTLRWVDTPGHAYPPRTTTHRGFS